MVNGHLKMIALKLLSASDESGYSLMKSIEKLTSGCWSPSPGSMYPVLESMRKAGFLSEKHAGRKNLYSITPKGREELASLMKITGSKEHTINHLRIMAGMSENSRIKSALEGAIAQIEGAK